jgi:hypothetical protein
MRQRSPDRRRGQAVTQQREHELALRSSSSSTTPSASSRCTTSCTMPTAQSTIRCRADDRACLLLAGERRPHAQCPVAGHLERGHTGADAPGGVGRHAGATRQLDPAVIVDIADLASSGGMIAIQCQRTSFGKPWNSSVRVP